MKKIALSILYGVFAFTTIAQNVLTIEDEKISVIGLGYIGLPLSLSFANCGFKVLGIDIDKQKIKNRY